jgi:hypothetical protein
MTQAVNSSSSKNRSIEHTQIDPQITYTLFQASHKIATSKNEKEIFDNLKNTIQQLPYQGALFAADSETFQPLGITDLLEEQTQLTSIPTIQVPPSEVVKELPKTYPISLTGLEEQKDKLPPSFVSIFELFGYADLTLYPLFNGTSLAGLLFLGTDKEGLLNSPVIRAITDLIEITTESLKKVTAILEINEQGPEHQLQKTLGQPVTTGTKLSQVPEIIDSQLFEITDKIWHSLDIQDVMKTTIEELCKALNIQRAQIEIALESESQADGENGSSSSGEEASE